MVGNWLYGVAHQTALKARATLAKQRTRERQMPTMPEIGVEPQHLRRELQLVLDQELSRLPDRYRVAIVLCDLEGRSRTEAARQLGIPPGTMAARLTRGRALLARRLLRHGLTVSGGMLATAFSEQAASACGPDSAMASTIKAVTSVAAGQAANAGMISVQVAALTEGMMKTMMLSKIRIATGLLLALTVTAAGGLLYTSRAEDPPRVEQKREDDLRAAAIKALEQFGKSEQESDREAAIKALVDFRRELKAAEEARKRHLDSTARFLADRFKYRVPVEIGASEFKDGGRIEILEVWGTRPKIEVGGQYLVRGKYAMPSHDRGRLYFYLTETNPGNLGGSLSAPPGSNSPSSTFMPYNWARVNLDLQSVEVRKGQGEFTLLHSMFGTGYFHLQMLTDGNKNLANVYFGTGDNVLRKKSW
jgi:hypothetical protein